MIKYTYDILFTSDYKPDIMVVNALPPPWELMQIGQSQSTGTSLQWWYLVRKAEELPAP